MSSNKKFSKKAIIYLLDRGSSNYILEKLEDKNYLVLVPYSFFYDNFYGSFKNYIYSYRLLKKIFGEKRIYRFDFGIFSIKSLEIFNKFIRVKKVKEIIINKRYQNSEFFRKVMEVINRSNVNIRIDDFWKEEGKYEVGGFLVRRNVKKDLEREVDDYLEILSKVRIRERIYYIKPLRIERIFYYPNEFFIIRKGKILEKRVETSQ